MRFSWRYTLLVKDYIDRCRKRSLFYISGYTAFKDGYPLKIYLRVPLMIQIFSIIQILRHHCYREKLSYPPAYLFELCCIFFSFCKKKKKNMHQSSTYWFHRNFAKLSIGVWVKTALE